VVMFQPFNPATLCDQMDNAGRPGLSPLSGGGALPIRAVSAEV